MNNIDPVFQRALLPYAPAERITEVKTPRIVRLLGGDARLASNDEGDAQFSPADEVDDATKFRNRAKDEGLGGFYHLAELRREGLL